MTVTEQTYPTPWLLEGLISPSHAITALLVVSALLLLAITVDITIQAGFRNGNILHRVTRTPKALAEWSVVFLFLTSVLFTLYRIQVRLDGQVVSTDPMLFYVSLLQLSPMVLMYVLTQRARRLEAGRVALLKRGIRRIEARIHIGEADVSTGPTRGAQDEGSPTLVSKEDLQP